MCWYCSRDSRRWESLLWSISVEDATVGTDGLDSVVASDTLSSCCGERYRKPLFKKCFMLSHFYQIEQVDSNNTTITNLLRGGLLKF